VTSTPSPKSSLPDLQESFGTLRRYETTTVQDETRIETRNGWRRKLVANVGPAAWYVDGGRVDTGRPYDPTAPPFDPHGLLVRAPAAEQPPPHP
jgi:hypothetical protein